jgi:hypothetical protein
MGRGQAQGAPSTAALRASGDEGQPWFVTADVYHGAPDDPDDEYLFGSVQAVVRLPDGVDLDSLSDEERSRRVRGAICQAVWAKQAEAGQAHGQTVIGTINNVKGQRERLWFVGVDAYHSSPDAPGEEYSAGGPKRVPVSLPADVDLDSASSEDLERLVGSQARQLVCQSLWDRHDRMGLPHTIIGTVSVLGAEPARALGSPESLSEIGEGQEGRLRVKLPHPEMAQSVLKQAYHPEPVMIINAATGQVFSSWAALAGDKTAALKADGDTLIADFTMDEQVRTRLGACMDAARALGCQVELAA